MSDVIGEIATIFIMVMAGAVALFPLLNCTLCYPRYKHGEIVRD